MEPYIKFVSDCVSAVLDWFVQCWSAVPGGLSYLLGWFAIMLSFRFLLMPLLPGMGGKSDTAEDSKRNKRNKASED